jgi:hypothetical protein
MFRTPVLPKISARKILLNDPLFLIGSCFSENIGRKLSENKFDSLSNPYGVIYNPASIFRLMEEALLEKPVNEGLILKSQGVYRHYNFHSDISSLDKEDLLSQIGEANKYGKIYLLQSKWILITLGTSIIYYHKKLKEIVSNCHKVPAKEFDKKRLNPGEIIESFDRFYQTLGSLNKDFNIILTVSPVRHIRDSFETNSISKSILRYACGVLSESYDNVQYFPSFEIMMDDLRDYRFYDTDMLHPNNSAIEYIWELFQQSYFSDDTRQFINEWGKIRNAMHHKPFFPDSREHQKFLISTIQKLKSFQGKVDISDELKLFEKQLI